MNRGDVHLNIRFLAILVLLTLSSSCINEDKRVGTYGSSENIVKSRKNKLFIAPYVPNKFSFRLVDSTVIKIDTAWAEAKWIYGENGKPVVPDSIVGFNFILPFSKQDFTNIKNFRFDFANLDTVNGRGFGLEESKWVFHPKALKDTIRILIQQRNPDAAVGWKRPIIKDTLVFKRK